MPNIYIENGDYPAEQRGPKKENPRKTRGITKTDARPQKGPKASDGFLKHTQKGKC